MAFLFTSYSFTIGLIENVPGKSIFTSFLLYLIGLRKSIPINVGVYDFLKRFFLELVVTNGDLNLKSRSKGTIGGVGGLLNIYSGGVLYGAFLYLNFCT